MMKRLSMALLVLLMLLAATASASAEISLDFSQQTSGIWQTSSSYSTEWADEIYREKERVNDHLPLIVPASTWGGWVEGWTADHTRYVSDYSSPSFRIVGGTPGEIYYVAFIVPRGDEEPSIIYTKAVMGEDSYFSVHSLGSRTGVYEDVTVVITDGTEVYNHTFSIQVQNVEEYYREEAEQTGEDTGMYFHETTWQDEFYCLKDETSREKKAAKGIEVYAPLDGQTLVGYEGQKKLSVRYVSDRRYSNEWHPQMEYELIDPATGEVVMSGTSVLGGWSPRDTYTDYYVSIEVPADLPAGQYRLDVKVWLYQYNDAWEQTNRTEIGTDSVTFFVEKCESPMPIFRQFIKDDLRFILKNGELTNGNYVVLLENYSKLHFDLAGMKPGVAYRCALIGVTADGEDFVVPFIAEAEGETNRYNEWVRIAARSGVYSDLTLVAVGDGKIIEKTFTCEVRMDADQESEEGVCITGYEGVDAFILLTDYADLSVPEAGYRCAAADGSVFSGYQGCALYIPIVFGADFDDECTFDLTLREAATDQLVKENRLTMRGVSGEIWNLGLVLEEDFVPGEYTMTMSCKGQESTCRIVLQKEENPFEMLKTKKALVRGFPKAEEQELKMYTVIGGGIIPEIKAYMAGMTMLETDVYNQFLRYSYVPGEHRRIGSFAIHAPNVTDAQVTTDQEDMLFAANWALRDFYSFQLKKMAGYTDEKVLDIAALGELFGESWKDMAEVEFASGIAIDEAGVVYYWLPVYYGNEQQGLTDNEIYLYVYILENGADTEYLDGLGYYNPLFYNEYHTTKLLITDQAAVRQMLQKLSEQNNHFELPEEKTVYTALRMEATGEAVRRLQKQLKKQGYLTTSVDAVFTPSVEEAVKAWQSANGLETTGVADAQMQQKLADDTLYRQLLRDWLGSSQH